MSRFTPLHTRRLLTLSLSLASREAAKLYMLALNGANFRGLLSIWKLHLLAPALSPHRITSSERSGGSLFSWPILMPLLHFSLPAALVGASIQMLLSETGRRKLHLLPRLRVKAISFLMHTVRVKEFPLFLMEAFSGGEWILNYIKHFSSSVDVIFLLYLLRQKIILIGFIVLNHYFISRINTTWSQCIIPLLRWFFQGL